MSDLRILWGMNDGHSLTTAIRRDRIISPQYTNAARPDKGQRSVRPSLKKLGGSICPFTGEFGYEILY